VFKQKLLGIGLIGQAPGQLERGMQVVVDHAGDHHPTMASNGLARLPLAHEISGFSHRHEASVFHRQGRVADDAALRVYSDEPVYVGD
jgi:hypothetical protein